MAITGTPTTAGDDIVTITPTGGYSVDGQGGTDTLVLDFSSLGADIAHSYVGNGYYRYTDDVWTSADYVNFERYDISTGAGDDQLVGGGLNDRLVGNAGNDRFDGGLGADTISGGSGVDRWVVDYSTIAGPVSVTLSLSGAANVAATGAVLTAMEALTMTTGNGADSINTETRGGNDAVSTGAGADSVALGRGIDSANGGDDVDTLRMDWSAVADPNASIGRAYIGNGWYRYANGIDRTDFTAQERFDLLGGAGDDTLYGDALNDTLIGNLGNDYLGGAAGIDSVSGGDGLDTWQLNTSAQASLTAVDLTTQTTNFGAALSGIERLEYTGGNAVDQVTALAGAYSDWFSTGDENDTVVTGQGADVVDLGAGTADKLVMDWSAITDNRHAISRAYTGSGWHRYSAGNGDRVDYLGAEVFDLRGGAGSDVLYGGSLNDTLIGNAGNDYLGGNTGIDSIAGGDGEDTWQVNTAAQASLTQLNLMAQTTNFGATISGIERLEYTGGSASDRIIALAGAHNDWFSTGDGSDIVTSGRGVDTVDLGLGASDKLVMDWSAISDPSHAISHSYIGNNWFRYQSASGDRLDYLGVEIFNLTGGAGDDWLGGGALNDALVGNGGDDTLASGVGDAVINGGLGNDLWSADLSVQGAALFDAAASQTTAQVTGLGLQVLGIERVSLTTGNSADRISTEGYALADNISAGGGGDVINGGLGYDTLDGGAGTDLFVLNYASATSAVYNSYIGNSWYRYQMGDGTNWADWLGMERFQLTGGRGNDVLSGGSLNDTLNGNDGNDWLNGGQGTDSINGGAGHDTYEGNYAAAATNMTLTLSEYGNGTVTGPGTKLYGIESVRLTTGAGADVIDLRAASGNDTVSTGEGADTVYTGRGTYESVDTGGGEDRLVIDAANAGTGLRQWYYGGGWTRMQSTDGAYTVDMAGVEHLDVLGSARSDRVYGFGLSDNLNGRAGVDFLNGGGGNDILTGGSSADLFIFTDHWNAGRDLITDGTAGDLVRISGLALSGAVMAGNGSAALAGQVYVDNNGATSTLHIGLDATAGADLLIDLTGIYGAANLALSGSDILFV